MGAFEILTLIAQLCIMFMSITIPTFAIAVSYLGAEASRVMERLENERKETEKKLEKTEKNLKSKMSSKSTLEKKEEEVKEMEKIIAEYNSKTWELKDRIAALSAKGTVLEPSFFFGIALLISALGIYYYPPIIITPSGWVITCEAFILVAIASTFMGLLFLWRSLKAIEKASIEMTKNN